MPLRRSLRLTLVVLGLALAVYGASTLTGGWLGVPPWWRWRHVTSEEVSRAWTLEDVVYATHGGSTAPSTWSGPVNVLPHQAEADEIIVERIQRSSWPAWPGSVLVGVGVALAAWGAWSRQRSVSP